jgi:hypothetical protein
VQKSRFRGDEQIARLAQSRGSQQSALGQPPRPDLIEPSDAGERKGSLAGAAQAARRLKLPKGENRWRKRLVAHCGLDNLLHNAVVERTW